MKSQGDGVSRNQLSVKILEQVLLFMHFAFDVLYKDSIGNDVCVDCC